MKKKGTNNIWKFFVRTILFCLLFLCSIKTIAQKKTLIFPIPQEMQLTGNAFALNEKISVIVPVNRSEKDISLARFLVRELSDKYGIAVKIETRNDIPKDKRVVIMGTLDNSLIKDYCEKNQGLFHHHSWLYY